MKVKQNRALNKTNSEEVFVVIAMSYFSDALVGNGLFQNIKKIYPNSKTVFIINKPYEDVAKYQKDVDETIVFDKNGEHKGILGLIKFIRKFPYKNVKCVLKMSRKTRVDIISLLLRPKKIVDYDEYSTIPAHKRYCNLLEKVTKAEIVYYPIVYNASDAIPNKLQNVVAKGEKHVALCAVSSNIIKDMPIQTTIELIDKLVADGYKILFVGTGDRTRQYACDLEKNNCKFINLVDKTTIYELAQVLRNCEGLISVDTGTMHLGYA
ncbi:MAG: glycosyltransferase family 9 protein, partial [bacterium]|nr:glycosyltransferase family 9 protein [bacterium]